ncbi:MAG: hypothetical protein ACLPN6_12220 [Streptosporangiaceae bacterium]
MTVVPVAMAALATLIRPAAWQHFTAGGVGGYALTPAARQPAAGQRRARPGRMTGSALRRVQPSGLTPRPARKLTGPQKPRTRQAASGLSRASVSCNGSA